MTLILSGSDGVTFPDSTEQETGYANGIGFRNRIINGDMRIDQRATSVSANTAGVFYSVDRFYGTAASSAGVFSLAQDTSAPTGFVNSIKVTVTTEDASIDSSLRYAVRQAIEGTNISDLSFGTASAKTITLSFWVRSSLTGTFGGVIQTGSGDRTHVFSYSISAADTFEYKTITIPGDTTGTWLTTTGIGIQLSFSLGAASNLLNTAGSWYGVNYQGATGQTNVIETNGATFFITGVQLEVGSVATPFERRPYGTELSLCQRYYQKAQRGDYAGRANGTTAAILGIPLLVAVRASPTLSDGGTTYLYSGGARVNSTGGTLTVLNFELETTSLQTSRTGFTGLTDDRAYNGVFTSTVTISAEL